MAQKKKDLNRISESDLLLPTLRHLAAQPDGWLSTSDLISALTNEFQPKGEDAEILDGRHDTKFSQIVRNMKSHKDSPEDIIALGFVKPQARGFAITDENRKYLASKGG
jgi:hypothetical protein